MSRLLSFLLAATTLFLTPVGVFTCSFLLPITLLSEEMPPEQGYQPGLTNPCEGHSLLAAVDTAVRSFLFTPHSE
ncbi:MAG: hypothetical protein HC804_02000 [Anaerolineae bacterium]|nr:hypothetical protein [Anaerolineae bacterium]